MRRYSDFLTMLCIVFSVVIAGLAVYAVCYWYDNYTANKDAEELMSQFENSYIEETPIENNQVNTEEPVEKPIEQPGQANNIVNETTEPTPSTGTSYGIGTYYKDKYKIIGIISIPTLKIQYPIFNVDNTTTLRVGTAAIYPANVEEALNKPGNVVIAGHNYRNSRMFSKLHTLKNGDSIYITNISGQKLEYKVYNNYTADENDFTYATRDTSNSTEISLSTCTNNSSTRTVVWAKVEE